MRGKSDPGGTHRLQHILLVVHTCKSDNGHTRKIGKRFVIIVRVFNSHATFKAVS